MSPYNPRSIGVLRVILSGGGGGYRPRDLPNYWVNFQNSTALRYPFLYVNFQNKAEKFGLNIANDVTGQVRVEMFDILFDELILALRP